MDILWNPWRYEYVKSGDTETPGRKACVFCTILGNGANDRENFILHRARLNFIILNVYPYISGHLMIVPFEHCAELSALPKPTTDEMMDLAKQTQCVMREVYQPNGFNLGMNLGRAAGAGVAEHLHLHILPRWVGDANFMTSIGETRTIPEDLKTTYEKLSGKF